MLKGTDLSEQPPWWRAPIKKKRRKCNSIIIFLFSDGTARTAKDSYVIFSICISCDYKNMTLDLYSYSHHCWCAASFGRITRRFLAPQTTIEEKELESLTVVSKGSDQRGTKEKKQRFLCGATKRLWILKTADLGFCGRGDEARRHETLPARRRRTSRREKAENRCTRCCRHSAEEDPGRNVPGAPREKKKTVPERSELLWWCCKQRGVCQLPPKNIPD